MHKAKSDTKSSTQYSTQHSTQHSTKYSTKAKAQKQKGGESPPPPFPELFFSFHCPPLPSRPRPPHNDTFSTLHLTLSSSTPKALQLRKVKNDSKPSVVHVRSFVHSHFALPQTTIVYRHRLSYQANNVDGEWCERPQTFVLIEATDNLTNPSRSLKMIWQLDDESLVLLSS